MNVNGEEVLAYGLRAVDDTAGRVLGHAQEDPLLLHNNYPDGESPLLASNLVKRAAKTGAADSQESERQPAGRKVIIFTDQGLFGDAKGWGRYFYRSSRAEPKVEKVSNWQELAKSIKVVIDKVDEIVFFFHSFTTGYVEVGENSYRLSHPDLKEMFKGIRPPSRRLLLSFEGCNIGSVPGALAYFGRLVGASEVHAWNQLHAIQVIPLSMMEFKPPILASMLKQTRLAEFAVPGVPLTKDDITAEFKNLKNLRQSQFLLVVEGFNHSMSEPAPFAVSKENWNSEYPEPLNTSLHPRKSAKIILLDDSAESRLVDSEEAMKDPGFGMDTELKRIQIKLL